MPNVLLEYKNLHSLTEKEIAEMVGVNKATIKSHLSGRSRPKPYLIKRYSDLFGLRPYDLFCIADTGWPEDLMGKRFDRMVVVDYVGSENTEGYNGTSVLWKCRCDCGTVSVVRSSHLTSGHTRSCGCLGESMLTAGGHNKLPVGTAAANTLLYNYKKSAKQRGYEWALTPQQFYDLTSGDCHYCGSHPLAIATANGDGSGNGDYVYNGIDRVDNSAGYVLDNVVSCCRVCNVAKSTMTKDEFLSWIENVYQHSISRGAK